MKGTGKPLNEKRYPVPSLLQYVKLSDEGGDEMEPTLTVREVSKILHVHSNTVRRWSDAGLIQVYRISHRGDRRFKREDIVRFLTHFNENKDDPRKAITGHY